MPRAEIDHVRGHNLRVQSSANFAKNVALILWGSAGLGIYLRGWNALWLATGYAIGGPCCFGFAIYLLGKLVKEVDSDLCDQAGVDLGAGSGELGQHCNNHPKLGPCHKRCCCVVI